MRKKNEPTTTLILNERERQTYYGALNCFSDDFYISPYNAGNGDNTVDYLKYLQKRLNDKKILIIWDGASYHRFSAMKEYLQLINKDLPPEEWKITCELFGSNVPEQNPVEDIWLQGKANLRKIFAENKTFAQVKKAFSSFNQNRKFDFPKIQMYRNFIL